MHATLAEVERMLDESVSFEDVETFIEDAELDEDARSALWLLAWVETDHVQRRGAVRELLKGLSGVPELVASPRPQG